MTVGIGLWIARRQKTTEDYFLAGRRMPWLMVAVSIFASLASAVSYLGIPSRAYDENVSLIAGYLLAPIGAIALIWLFYPFYHRLQVTTSYEYLGKRFGQPGRLAGSGLFILARLGWLGAVIYGPALALNVATGIRVEVAIVLMGLLATTYTALGGLSAVIWTDVVQFAIFVFGGIWVSVSLIDSVPGGLGGIMEIARQSGRIGGLDWFSLTKMSAGMAMVSTLLLCMQDYGTDQVTVRRVMAIKSFSGKVKALLLNSVFDVLIVGMLLFMGIGLFAYSHHNPQWLIESIKAKTDRILPYYIMTSLPCGVSGLIISAIFAAAMSSMDSGIHSLSTVVINDFVRPLRRRAASDRTDLILARALVVAFGVAATTVAFWVSKVEHIIEASYTVLGMFSGPILALFVLGVLTRRANFVGWLIGAAVGIGFTFYLQNYTETHWLFFYPASFGLAITLGYLASLVIGGPKAEAAMTIWGRRGRLCG